jgi:hypothetical protein
MSETEATEASNPAREKSKPGRSWRVLLTEVGIVVLGVGLALAAQQTAEWWSDRSRIADARANIRAEIAANLGLMASRSAVEACVSRRLDEIDVLIRTSSGGMLSPDVLWIGRPPVWGMRNNQYSSAAQSGTVSKLPVSEQASYAAIYVAFADYYQAENAEQQAWNDLRTLEQHPTVSPVIDWQLRAAIQKARSSRWLMETTSNSTKNAAATLGVKADRTVIFKPQSVCIPLRTERPEALKQVIQGRPDRKVYDEP